MSGSLYVVAGEMSGDAHAAGLLEALLPRLSAEVSAATLLDALVPLAAAGAVPERAEWDGIAAAAGATPNGASTVLSLDELERLLRRQGN